MKIALVSRYPRFDVAEWKVALLHDLVGEHDVEIVYSGKSLRAHLQVAWRERGLIASARSMAGRSVPATLGRRAKDRGLAVTAFDSLRGDAPLRHFEQAGYEAALLLNAEIVPPEILAVIEGPVLNVHYGLLPAYRGLHATEWAILEDAPVGVSVHLVDAGVDTGAIVAQREVQVRPGDDLKAIRAKQAAAAREMVLPALERVIDGSAAITPQGPGRRYRRMPRKLRLRVEDRLSSGEYRWIDG